MPELLRLVEATDEPLSAPGARQIQAETVAHLPDRFAAILASDDKCVLVAVDELGNIVGMVLVSEGGVGAVTAVPAVHISNLLVARKYRRRGIGRALLAATVHLADQRGIEHIVASVVAGSRDANRYLARLGFAPLVVRRLATTTTLRRSLGIVDGSNRVALLRRARRRGRSLTGRVISRGA
ncbi:MAG TPA: GNAT family N-acetyltransferase [Jatrophihabitantaceae bacterium]|nr:GNAT family N-acetyltransferase [Jatrophihabitantaceae bacterium]